MAPIRITVRVSKKGGDRGRFWTSAALGGWAERELGLDLCA